MLGHTLWLIFCSSEDIEFGSYAAYSDLVDYTSYLINFFEHHTIDGDDSAKTVVFRTKHCANGQTDLKALAAVSRNSRSTK